MWTERKSREKTGKGKDVEEIKGIHPKIRSIKPNNKKDRKAHERKMRYICVNPSQDSAKGQNRTM